LVEILKKLLSNVHQCTNKVDDLNELKKIIQEKNPQFEGKRQQDAHEFLMTCFNFISEEKFEDCPVGSNFNFVIQKSFYCTKCKDKTVREEDFIDIILNLCDGKDVSDLVELFFRRDELEKKCEKCFHNNSVVTSEIKKLPKYFILQLKRFQPDFVNDEFRLKKIEIFEKLNFQKFCQTDIDGSKMMSGGECEYELKSIVVHHGGSPNIGHYISFIKDKEGVWRECDDDCITKQKGNVLEEKSVKKNAYILFYEKILKS
jgi:uncharacterized UBP type Zn finger protein